MVRLLIWYPPQAKGEAAWGNYSELPNQIRKIRENNHAQGSIFFSSKSLATVARSLADSLKNNFYKYPALPPQMPWLDNVPPNEPQNLTIEVHKEGISLKWQKPLKAADGETASGYVVYRFNEGEKPAIYDPRKILHIAYEDYPFYLDTSAEKGKRYTYIVTALDRLKNESKPSEPVQLIVDN